MTPRERFIAALERRPLTGRVPHFELVFFLTMEAFGKVHPSHRNYQAVVPDEEHERELHRDDMAESISTPPSATSTAPSSCIPPGHTWTRTGALMDMIRDRSRRHATS